MNKNDNKMLLAISELLDKKLSSELHPIKTDLGVMKENISVVLKLVLDLKEDVDFLKAKNS